MDAVSVALRLVEDVAERAVVSSRLFLKPSKFLGVKAGCPVDKGNSSPELLQVLGKVSYPRESSMRFLCLLSRWTHASATYTSPVGLLPLCSAVAAYDANGNVRHVFRDHSSAKACVALLT